MAVDGARIVPLLRLVLRFFPLSDRLEDRKFFSRVEENFEDLGPFPKNDEKEEGKK